MFRNELLSVPKNWSSNVKKCASCYFECIADTIENIWVFFFLDFFFIIAGFKQFWDDILIEIT